MHSRVMSGYDVVVHTASIVEGKQVVLQITHPKAYTHYTLLHRVSQSSVQYLNSSTADLFTQK